PVAAHQNELPHSHHHLAALYRTTGRPDLAEAALAQAVALREALFRDHPGVPPYQCALAQDHVEQSRLFDATNRPEQAEQALLKALEHQEQLVQAHPTVADYQNDLAIGYNHLGSFYLNRGTFTGPIEAPFLKAL